MTVLPPELMALLRTEEQDSVDIELDGERAAALDYYHGRPMGDEEEGRSQVVTRDVAEVVDYMTVSILRTMVSGDKVVEFDGEDEQDDDAAAEAGEVISDRFMRAGGYRKLHDWLKAGLLEKSGIIKTWVEPQSRVVPLEVSADALADMPVAELAFVEPMDALDMQFRVGVKEPLPPKFMDETVANEEFRVSRGARTLDDATYLAHITPKRLSDLVAMGFDTAEVNHAWDGNADSRVVAQARTGGKQDGRNGYSEGANRRVWLREEYVLFDLDGDGEVERLCVHRVGDTVLNVEEVEDHPFVHWTPYPAPHRLNGEGLADKTMDIQRVRSVLRRQLLDNLYLSNAPRTTVDENGLSENTIDDLLAVRPGGIIRYKGAKPEPYATPFVAGPVITMDEVMVGERESRSGITRLNQGLDADALNKTATGTAMMQATGQQMEEYLARNFAEAVGQLFLKKLALYHRHGQPMKARIDGEYREVDPCAWNPAMNVRVNVGLGSGRKDQRLGHRMAVLEMQKEAVAAGKSNLVTDKNLYHSLKGVVADAGLGNVNDFFSDPGDEPEQEEERKSPEEMKVEADAMLRAEEMRARREEAALNLELRREENAAKIELARDEHAMRIELERDRAETEAELAREKMDREWTLAVDRANREDSDRRIRDASMPASRPGGSLAA